MKINRKLMTCLAALVCLSLTNTVRADDQNPPTGATQTDPTTPSDRTSPGYERQHERHGSKYDTTTESTATGQPSKFNKASKLIGMDVKNEQGEDLGDIKDIVINLDSGTVSYAVLSSGGVLGVGEKLLAVPLTAFKRSADQRHLVLQASQSNISQAQSIGNDWPSVQNPSFGAMPFWQQGVGDTNRLRGTTPSYQRPGQQ
jgi:sporulation protein YlmC with PRC-barrel domain